jgi:hypothetical protein
MPESPAPASIRPGGLVRARRADLAWRRAGDEVVVLDLAAASYHALNPSGAMLWERLADWVTAEELTEALAAEFGLDAAAAARDDVARFLDGCAGAGLLEVRPER